MTHTWINVAKLVNNDAQSSAKIFTIEWSRLFWIWISLKTGSDFHLETVNCIICPQVELLTISKVTYKKWQWGGMLVYCNEWIIINGNATWRELEMIQVLVEKVVCTCGKREKYTTIIWSQHYFYFFISKFIRIFILFHRRNRREKKGGKNNVKKKEREERETK